LHNQAVGGTEPDTTTDNTRANQGAGIATGRAGGESAPTESSGKSGEAGGPGHGQTAGGAKGMAGANATSGGPFQSQSGETTAKGV